MELYIFASFLNLFFYMIKLVLNKTFFLLLLIDLDKKKIGENQKGKEFHNS